MNEKEFWANMKRNENGCLVWQKAIDKKGYGRVQWKGKWSRAHRVAWSIVNGAISQSQDIHHLPTCNKACCEISHLTPLGHAEHTALTNTLGQILNRPTGDRNGTRLHPERVSRGDKHHAHLHPERMARGEKNGGSKLTRADVQEIRTLHDNGMTFSAISRLKRISDVHVGRIVKGVVWKHYCPQTIKSTVPAPDEATGVNAEFQSLSVTTPELFVVDT